MLTYAQLTDTSVPYTAHTIKWPMQLKITPTTRPMKKPAITRKIVSIMNVPNKTCNHCTVFYLRVNNNFNLQ